MRWICDACATQFVADEGRCPRCLHITTVRDADAAPPALAPGRRTVRRRTLLALSIALSIPGAAACIVLGKRLDTLFWPLVFASLAFASACVRVPRALPVEAYDTWGRALRQWAIAVALIAPIALAAAFGGSVAASMVAPIGVVGQTVCGIAVTLGIATGLLRLTFRRA